jgi:hypothetical protein
LGEGVKMGERAFQTQRIQYGSKGAEVWKHLVCLENCMQCSVARRWSYSGKREERDWGGSKDHITEGCYVCKMSIREGPEELC